MKQKLRLQWRQLQPQPDPTFGVPLPRSSHGLSFLPHRHSFLMYGGAQGSGKPISLENHCWECCLRDNTPQWRRWPAPFLRIGHAQAVYADRYLYLFGGRIGPRGTERNDLWMLDTNALEEGVWHRVRVEGDQHPSPRAHHAMRCIDHSLFVYGGYQGNRALTDGYQFDLQQRTWLPMERLRRASGGTHLIALQGGQNLTVMGGGDCLDVYDEDERTWYRIQNGAVPWRSGGLAAGFPLNQVAVLFGGAGYDGEYENDLVVLDETTGRVVGHGKAPKEPNYGEKEKCTKPWPSKRAWSAADAHEDKHGTGNLYLFGGLGGNPQQPQPLQDVWQLQIQKV